MPIWYICLFILSQKKIQNVSPRSESQVCVFYVSILGKRWREEWRQLSSGCLQWGTKRFRHHGIFCVKKQKPLSLSHLSLFTHHRIQRLLEEVLPTRLGRTDWTRVACWRRMLRWVRPPSPPPAAHLHPNPKRLMWWVIGVIIALWSSFSSFL